MVRILVFGVLIVLAFAGTVVMLMAVNGQLNGDAINRVLGRGEDEAGMAGTEDTLGPLARRLQAEQERLATMAADLEERETRLGQREQDLAKLRDEIVQRQEQLAVVLDQLDEQQLANIKEVAERIEAMDEEQAALVLAEFPPEQSAEILRNIKSKSGGAILDALTQDKRTLILQFMQQPLY